MFFENYCAIKSPVGKVWLEISLKRKTLGFPTQDRLMWLSYLCVLATKLVKGLAPLLPTSSFSACLWAMLYYIDSTWRRGRYLFLSQNRDGESVALQVLLEISGIPQAPYSHPRTFQCCSLWIFSLNLITAMTEYSQVRPLYFVMSRILKSSVRSQ